MQRIPSIWVYFTTQGVIQNGSVFRYQTHTSGRLYIGVAPPPGNWPHSCVFFDEIPAMICDASRVEAQNRRKITHFVTSVTQAACAHKSAMISIHMLLCKFTRNLFNFIQIKHVSTQIQNVKMTTLVRSRF